MTRSAEAADVDPLHNNKISAVLKSVTMVRARTRERHRGI